MIGTKFAPLLPARPGSSRGQVLVVVALMFLILLGFAGLAVDVSSAYSTRRLERSIADAAALAGAQDLQTAGSRAVTPSEQIIARRHALELLTNRLGAAAPTGCNPSSDITDCSVGATYHVAVKTPALSCAGGGTSTCDPAHSVQVSIHNPQFQTAFARLFGPPWDVGVTSVAGITFATKYAIETLRPYNWLNTQIDQNKDDINLAGSNTWVNILQGDVGTNSYVVTNANNTPGAYLQLASGYFLDHVDNISPDGWNKQNGLPQGRVIPPLLLDPDYTYPARPADRSVYDFQTQGDGLDGTLPAGPCVGAPSGADVLPAGTKCFKPGIYRTVFSFPGNVSDIYLEPGVYFFDKGITIGSGQNLWGGVVSGQRGVAIVVPQSLTQGNKGFDGTSAQWLILNRGGSTCVVASCRALPALDVAGNETKTAAGLTLSIFVQRDGACFVGTTPQLCNDSQNKAVNLGGSAGMIVAGVIYGPSDKVHINSNWTTQQGVVGQIIAWTVTYTGGSKLNQQYPASSGFGQLRIDSACSAPGEPCNP
jgi:Flp pilus assembly protein TadG